MATVVTSTQQMAPQVSNPRGLHLKVINWLGKNRFFVKVATLLNSFFMFVFLIKQLLLCDLFQILELKFKM